MPLVACFLRAVNVGGRRATNDELLAAAATAGLSSARAYQAAGNLVVDAGGRTTEAVAAALERSLAASLGFVTEVIVRDAAELATAIEGVPWDEVAVTASVGKPQVVLCRRTPDEDTAAAALALATGDDPLVLVGRDLHWLPMAGTGRSALDTRRLHELLHPATARTVGTLERLLARFMAG